MDSVWVECKKGCSKENVYIADELWTFYNMTPNAVFTFKGERYDPRKDVKIIQWFECFVNMVELIKTNLFLYSFFWVIPWHLNFMS
jgi:hypothetical protein